MREIKFRVWKGEMHYPQVKGSGQYLSFFPEGLIPWGVYEQGTDARLVTGDPNAIFNEPGTLMQYTGLKDKNGKEIYERDIFRYSILDLEFSEDETVYTEEVSFVNGGFELDNAPLGAFHEEGEVIGNIYENPELCK